jgi:hypothetical protein
VKIQQVALRGIPDFLLCISGYFVAIELKRTAKSPITELQKHNIDKILASGGEAFIVSPENWEEVYVKLKNLSEIVR